MSNKREKFEKRREKTGTFIFHPQTKKRRKSETNEKSLFYNKSRTREIPGEKIHRENHSLESIHGK